MWSLLINEINWKKERKKHLTGTVVFQRWLEFFVCSLLSSARLLRVSSLKGPANCIISPNLLISVRKSPVSCVHSSGLCIANRWHSCFHWEPVTPVPLCFLLQLLFLFIYRDLIPTLKEKPPVRVQAYATSSAATAGQKPSPATVVLEWDSWNTRERSMLGAQGWMRPIKILP